MALKAKSVLRVAWWGLTAAGLLGTLAEAANLQSLPGHVLPAARSLSPLARLEASRQLQVAICLPLVHTNELNQLLAQIYDPASPQFHHYVSAEEFARRFGPAVEDYAAVGAYCRSKGLSIVATHPNRTVLEVAGPAEAFERVFHTTLRVYRHPTEARNFFAPETEPSIDLAVPLLRVDGLDDFYRHRPLSRRLQAAAGLPRPGAGSGTSGSYQGSDFRQAYAPGVSLDGGGQVLALVEFDGFYTNDIIAYEQWADVPGVPLQTVLVGGFKGKPDTNNMETALDIEVAMAMAPGLKKIMVYESAFNSSASGILNRIATDNVARQISSSWMGGAYSSGTDQIFKQYAAQGQSYFQASGDSGAYSGSVYFPADDPYVTVVGGTTLSTQDGEWSAESAWNDGDGHASGGGYSATYALPSWQSGLSMAANGGSASRRNLPDVAMLGDNVFCIADNGQHERFMGTSISAPLWAAFTALINQQAALNGQPAIGFLNPALYSIGKSASYSDAFHDIASGDNGTNSRTRSFRAVAGYDLCTGWGTPTGSNTIGQILKLANPFLSNPWPFLQGSYAGLFLESNAVAQQSSGAFALKLTTKGTFSGTLQNGAARYSLSGKFDLSGHARLTNGPRSMNPMYVDLQLEMNLGADRLSGTVSNALWSAGLAGDRAVFNAKTNRAPQTGQYTMILPGTAGDTNEPAGDGFAMLTVGTAGQVRLAISFSEGTKASQASTLSKNGQWPLYVPLYSGQGSVVSWMTITNPGPDSVLGGELVWTKPVKSTAKYYPKGFARQSTAYGAFYQAPAGTNKLLGLSQAQLVLSGGDLIQPVTNQFLLGARSRVTCTNKLTLSFTPSSGLFRGSLRRAQAPKTVSFSGVVLQNETNGSGFLLGTNQSGRVILGK